MNPNCLVCKKPLIMIGNIGYESYALILGPADSNGKLTRARLCKTCWLIMFNDLLQPPNPAVLKRRARRAKPLAISSKPSANPQVSKIPKTNFGTKGA